MLCWSETLEGALQTCTYIGQHREWLAHDLMLCVAVSQDNGYLHPESWKVLQVTAWIPLLDATRRNGCMQVIKGGHRAGKTCKHTCCVGGTW